MVSHVKNHFKSMLSQFYNFFKKRKENIYVSLENITFAPEKLMNIMEIMDLNGTITPSVM